MNQPTCDAAKLGKLPKWAQDHIALLVRYAEEQRREYVKITNNEYSDVSYNGGTYPRENVYIPSRYIDFDLSVPDGRKKGISVAITSDHEGHKYLRVAGLNGSVIIKPGASNVFDVYAERF